MAEPRPPNRPWSPRRSPRRSRRAGPLGVRASELQRLQLDEYDAYSRARGAIASTGEALPRREGYRTHTSESFQMQAYPAWGYVGTLGAVAALNNNPPVVIRQLQSVSGNQSAIIRNNPQQFIRNKSVRNNPSAITRPQSSIRNNPTATIHPQQSNRNKSVRNNPSSLHAGSWCTASTTSCRRQRRAPLSSSCRRPRSRPCALF